MWCRWSNNSNWGPSHLIDADHEYEDSGYTTAVSGSLTGGFMTIFSAVVSCDLENTATATCTTTMKGSGAGYNTARRPILWPTHPPCWYRSLSHLPPLPVRRGPYRHNGRFPSNQFKWPFGCRRFSCCTVECHLLYPNYKSANRLHASIMKVHFLCMSAHFECYACCIH